MYLCRLLWWKIVKRWPSEPNSVLSVEHTITMANQLCLKMYPTAYKGKRKIIFQHLWPWHGCFEALRGWLECFRNYWSTGIPHTIALRVFTENVLIWKYPVNTWKYLINVSGKKKGTKEKNKQQLKLPLITTEVWRKASINAKHLKQMSYRSRRTTSVMATASWGYYLHRLT